jgi:hypothetical protein
MRRMRYGRGDSKIGCAIWVTLLAVFVFVCYKAVPVKLASSTLQDFMTEEAKFAGNRSAEQIKKRVLERADELEIPLDPKKLEVKRGQGRVRMVAKYTVPIVFPGYTYYWDFELNVDRPIFLV